MAGSSGSSGSDAVANAAFTSLADVNRLAAGARCTESSSGVLSRRQLATHTPATMANSSVEGIRTVEDCDESVRCQQPAGLDDGQPAS
jgi:hypothetical protein